MLAKVTSLENSARNEYDSFILIDFSKAPQRVRGWFDEYLEDIDTLLQNIQLHYKKKLATRKSLIIFDEVQKCPKAREAIKALVEDGRFDYLETGSLISIKKNVENIVIPSEEDGIDMYPMDFEEFLWAMDNEVLMPYIRKQFEKCKPMGDFHREALHYFLPIPHCWWNAASRSRIRCLSGLYKSGCHQTSDSTPL